MDSPEASAGNTAYFPVNTKGALLFFGKASCVQCHAVSARSNEMFSDFNQWTPILLANQGVPVDIVIGANHGNNKIEIVTDEKAVWPRDANVPTPHWNLRVSPLVTSTSCTSTPSSSATICAHTVACD